MAKILQLDQENYDLWLSYSWSRLDHGVCGHVFEVVEYYFFLKNYYRVGILIGDGIKQDDFIKLVKEKYDVEDCEIETMKQNLIFENRPLIVRGNNILFTDGGIKALSEVTLFFDKIFYFACAEFDITHNQNPNVFVLQDERIYKKCYNGIHYVKKILFSKYKKISKKSVNVNLLYGTASCRNISIEMYKDLLETYPEDFICLTNKVNRPKNLPERLKFLEMPVSNLFEKFDTYIYTPVAQRFDCSPRFIAECKFYNKRVIFHKIDYWDEDKGLYWRNWDVENNFESLFLDKADSMLSILKEKI